MATMITHHGSRIFLLDEEETVMDHAGPNDTVVVRREDGWWVYFVSESGEVEGYDEPYASQSRAVGAAKAAAEFAGE